MEFLYSLNRFNVATSRAQAVVIVVGSPRLLEPECRSQDKCSQQTQFAATRKMAQVLETGQEPP